MGEYALYNGKRIKIGTCEDMYYLRADQTRQVYAQQGNVNPSSSRDQKEIRFRFPWPDEDHIQPGAFENFGRAVAVYGVELPESIEHDNVQFSAQAGYLISLPCPEGPEALKNLTVHRNGFAGNFKIRQQAYRNGNLALIGSCGGCGAPFNLPTWKDAEPVVVACRAEADKALRIWISSTEQGDKPRAKWWDAIADRIAAGYPEAKLGLECANVEQAAE
jgi:hypothetical protein